MANAEIFDRVLELWNVNLNFVNNSNDANDKILLDKDLATVEKKLKLQHFKMLKQVTLEKMFEKLKK